MTKGDFQWVDLNRTMNPDPCLTQVFEVDACGPSFDAVDPETDAMAILEAAKMAAIDNRDFELAVRIREFINAEQALTAATIRFQSR